MPVNRGRFKGKRSNEPKKHGPRERERTLMLSLNKMTVFRYGLREIMSNYKVDEATASSVIASVMAKASRISIDSAKKFIREQETLGVCPKAVSDEIYDLLERFSMYR